MDDCLRYLAWLAALGLSSDIDIPGMAVCTAILLAAFGNSLLRQPLVAVEKPLSTQPFLPCALWSRARGFGWQ